MKLNFLESVNQVTLKAENGSEQSCIGIGLPLGCVPLCFCSLGTAPLFPHLPTCYNLRPMIVLLLCLVTLVAALFYYLCGNLFLRHLLEAALGQVKC